MALNLVLYTRFMAVVGGGGHTLLQVRRSPAVQGGSLSSVSGQGVESLESRCPVSVLPQAS